MSEHILFLTGKLARPSLARVLEEMRSRDFTSEIRVPGVSVAALMTVDLILRRLGDTGNATRVVLPGRCRGDIERLRSRFGVPFERGPEELKDLPAYFGGERAARDLSRHEVTIFAEIVDAPRMQVRDIVERAHRYARDGADVIDVGCLPDTGFAHLEESVRALKAEGFGVSVDSMSDDELLRGAGAGADYLLSLTEESLWIAEEVDSVPVLIGTAGADPASLYRAIERMQGRRFYADAILDPIHMGFTESLRRYQDLRRRFPDVAIMMGTGNLTELTHADTAGITAILLGIASELRVSAVLTTEVSPHCRRVVRETDLARRIMHAAREDNMPPQHVSDALLALHERKPFPYRVDELVELAGTITDRNYRIQVSEAGIHVFNNAGIHTAVDPYELFPALQLDDDPAHAFYLGLELARAQIAWQLGKRYQQDEELAWGCAVDRAPPDLTRFAAPRTTLNARKTRRRRSHGNSRPA